MAPSTFLVGDAPYPIADGEDAQAWFTSTYYCAVDAAYYKRCTVQGDAIRTSVPTETGRQWHKGVEELRWFSIPLTWVSTPERLVRVVDAAVALWRGDESPARGVVAETSD